MGDITIDDVDEITLTDATLTPLFTMQSSAAYSVFFKFKTAAGSVKIHMGSDTLTIDMAAETVTLNSETARSFPTHDNSAYSLGNYYVCPTHSMGEASVLLLSSANPFHPVRNYGASVVDSADPTVSTSWTLEVVG